MRKLLGAIILMLCSTGISAEEVSKITVVGQGMVSVVPDMANINLGVVTLGRTAHEALKDNSRAMQNVFSALEKNGLPKKDIQTSQLNLNPQWDRRNNNGEPPKIVGYQAVNNVTVQVRDLEMLGSVLDQLSKVGANNMNGISFGLQQTDGPMNEARKNAVKNARQKAELYATAAGVKLGEVLSIHESGGGHPRPMMRMAEAAMMDAVPIAEGTMQMSSSITMVYELVE